MTPIMGNRIFGQINSSRKVLEEDFKRMVVLLLWFFLCWKTLSTSKKLCPLFSYSIIFIHTKTLYKEPVSLSWMLTLKQRMNKCDANQWLNDQQTNKQENWLYNAQFECSFSQRRSRPFLQTTVPQPLQQENPSSTRRLGPRLHYKEKKKQKQLQKQR